MQNVEYNNNHFIGVLATDEEYSIAVGDNTKRSVFINGQNDIQYSVRALSENAPTRFFTGYLNSINDNGMMHLDDETSFDEESERKRVASFKEKLKNFMFVFTSRSMPSDKGDGKKFHKINHADLVARPAPVKDTDSFVTIPVFSPKEINADWEYRSYDKLQRPFSTYDGFLNCIKSGKSIGKVSHYDNNDPPRFIVWYNEGGATGIDDKFCAVGPFTSFQTTAQGGYILEADELYEIDLTPYEDYMVYSRDLNPTLLHMVESVYEKICNQFVTTDGATLIYSKTEDGHNVVDTPEYEEAPRPLSDVSLIDIDPSVKDDSTFLKTFSRLCEDNGLFYAPMDLTNIHTAMKTGSLVILSGMSGTGKSAIVDMYARALGLGYEDENRMLIVPVRPSWNDDSDLLGYVDLIHMVYRASDTGFVKLIVEASKPENRDKLYVVCFDEMNLARVEHYFSQFLSILEKPVGKRKLRLYDEQYRGRLYNSSEYPDVIDLQDNVRFVGTVNIDESTYHFADKVLDRANVISLHVLPFNSWKKHPYSSKAIQEWSYDEYKAISANDTKFPTAMLRDFLWEFHLMLQEKTSNMGIGPRIVRSIENYINNLPISVGEFTIAAKDGIDIQIKQRVLTKLRGSEDQFSQLLGDDDLLINLFDKYNELSEFTESRKCIEQKKKELKVYGYCL